MSNQVRIERLREQLKQLQQELTQLERQQRSAERDSTLPPYPVASAPAFDYPLAVAAG